MSDIDKKQTNTTATTAAAGNGSNTVYYRIGTPGKPWGDEERSTWQLQTKVHRSYKRDVIDRIENIVKTNDSVLELIEYGFIQSCSVLKENNDERYYKYPLYAVKTRQQNWQDENTNNDINKTNDNKPWVCITGGVHGYETSGVMACLQFIETKILHYSNYFNIIVFPCISPWSYERIERWNPNCKDPNRCFLPNKKEECTEETIAVINYLEQLHISQWICAIDLHETTDSDETEYMPARAAAEKGESYIPEIIPDGFYLFVNASNPQYEWCTCIIEAVKKITHIAQPDDDGLILGEPVGDAPEGIVPLPAEICVGDGMSVTKATYRCTTEIYPDSSRVDDELCNKVHLTVIVAALDYIKEQH